MEETVLFTRKPVQIAELVAVPTLALIVILAGLPFVGRKWASTIPSSSYLSRRGST